MYIPLTKPYWGKKEEQAVFTALKTSSGAGDGIYTKKLQKELGEYTKSRFVIPVTSATHGLELAMVALGVGLRDEVIVPSFTMSSTANCVALRGAIPVFADIESMYYGIDPKSIEQKITKKTVGIIVVHYAGMPCDIERILALAKKHHLFVVEDAAHAIGVSFGGKQLGTFGDIGVYSFHGTKNISCGEGGVVLTNNQKLSEKMDVYRANGTNRAAFLSGIVDKYSWVGIGTSYFLSDILASIVIRQIDQIDIINKKRDQIARFYTKSLSKYSSIFQIPVVPKSTVPNWHIYAVLFKTVKNRTMFLQSMRKKGVDVAYHYVPLHSSKMGNTFSKFQPKGNSLPITESVWERLIRLPIYPGLTNKELRYIISSAYRILEKMR